MSVDGNVYAVQKETFFLIPNKVGSLETPTLVPPTATKMALLNYRYTRLRVPQVLAEKKVIEVLPRNAPTAQ